MQFSGGGRGCGWESTPLSTKHNIKEDTEIVPLLHRSWLVLRMLSDVNFDEQGLVWGQDNNPKITAQYDIQW